MMKVFLTLVDKLTKLLAIGVIYFWHYLMVRILSFVTGQVASCRFYPSCSIYCQSVIAKFGIFNGIKLAAARIIRCNPWGGSGVDLP